MDITILLATKWATAGLIVASVHVATALQYPSNEPRVLVSPTHDVIVAFCSLHCLLSDCKTMTYESRDFAILMTSAQDRWPNARDFMNMILL